MDRNTTLSSSLLHYNPRCPQLPYQGPAPIPMLPSTTQPRHPSIISLLRLPRPAAPKLWNYYNNYNCPELLHHQGTPGCYITTFALQFPTGRLSNVKVEISDFTGSVVDLKWENTFFNGHHLLWYLLTPSSLLTLRLFHMLESLLLLSRFALRLTEVGVTKELQIVNGSTYQFRFWKPMLKFKMKIYQYHWSYNNIVLLQVIRHSKLKT
jgi:hypothetical protein